MGIEERKEREKQQRRDAILDAAERLFFSKGMENSTMDEVAREAEFSKGTIYLYFKNKEELYLGITNRGLDILKKIFKQFSDKAATGIEKVEAIGYAYLEFSQKHRDYFDSMLYYESHVLEFTDENPCASACESRGQEVLDILVQAINYGINDGSINKDLDAQATAIVLWGQTMGVIQIVTLKREHFEEKHNVNFEEIIHLSFQLMINSIRA